MKKINIGLAGLGNVGRGVYEILHKDSEILAKRTGFKFEITAVSARNKKPFITDKVKFYDNPIDLANDPEIDVVVEVIGGCDIAKRLVEVAIKNGKKVVTANKALIAEHGANLAELVEKHQSFFGFEAAVCGGMPIIKVLREGLVANEVSEIYGILNGTCNFILTKMQREGLDFAFVLKQAQDLGYAEANPSADIHGTDTAHKITILAAIAGAIKPSFNQVFVEGIDKISIHDIRIAESFGFKIKLLASYKNLGETRQIAIYPALIPSSEKLAQVDDAFNAVLSKASNANWNFMVGSGAGSLPTASAVVSDLVDATRNYRQEVFLTKCKDLSEARFAKIEDRVGRYFLSLVLAKNVDSKDDLEKVIFGSKAQFDRVDSFISDSGIVCGFLTKPQKEKDISKLLQTLDSKLIQSAKFLRVEEKFGL